MDAGGSVHRTCGGGHGRCSFWAKSRVDVDGFGSLSSY
jgi:hypothetical protein